MSPLKSINAFIVLAGMLLLAGCGTTRTTNTQRTATEQLLISDAIDRAVQEVNFSALAGESVYFDEQRLNEVVDQAYLISSMRQHLLASGCVLKDKREQATFIVEPRVGAVGTDNHDLLFGIPATNIPQLTLLSGLPPALPEIPIAKRRNQRGVAKIAVFAYRRESGAPVWQSGIASSESTANDIWVLGAGPFKRGTIHQGTSFAGQKLSKLGGDTRREIAPQVVTLNQEALFQPSERTDGEIRQATAHEPVDPSQENNGPRVLPPPQPGFVQ
ncbi:MAG: hypothetical protein MI725_00800 [Pirellulales bacterium]|nr:hypothetical protein [Pirellulales bacterium]